MMTTIIAIDPGTRTAGVCVLAQEGSEWIPLYTGEIVRDTADPVAMSREVLAAIGQWLGPEYRPVLAVIEDYRPRSGQSGAAARVLEVIGVLRYVLSTEECDVRLMQHTEWRARWLDCVLGAIAGAGAGAGPQWMDDMGEHERDAARMAWAVAHTRIAG